MRELKMKDLKIITMNINGTKKKINQLVEGFDGTIFENESSFQMMDENGQCISCRLHYEKIIRRTYGK